MKDSYTFAKFILEKRKEAGKTSRGLAAEVNITPAYMSDIENGRRNPPKNYLDALAKALNLSSDDSNLMYDLAAKDMDSTPIDLTGYIMDTELARKALRRAKNKEISNEVWEKIIKVIEEE